MPSWGNENMSVFMVVANSFHNGSVSSATGAKVPGAYKARLQRLPQFFPGTPAASVWKATDRRRRGTLCGSTPFESQGIKCGHLRVSNFKHKLLDKKFPTSL